MNSNAQIKAAEVLPVFDDMLELAQVAVAENEALQKKIATLEAKLAEKDVILEKVANAPKQPVLEPSQVRETLDQLVSLNIMDEAQATKIASEAAVNPNSILSLLPEISRALLASTLSSEGLGVEKEASGPNDADPNDLDGWNAFAEGRRVLLKR